LSIWLQAKHICCFICSSPLAGAGRTFTPQLESLRRFIIRADVHYDAESKLLTAHLELPGLKKRDLSITLSTCLYNRVRQVVIAGRSKPTLPETGYAIKERKFGEFSRTFAVPPETKVRLLTRTLLLGLTHLLSTVGRCLRRNARWFAGSKNLNGPTRRIRRLARDCHSMRDNNSYTALSFTYLPARKQQNTRTCFYLRPIHDRRPFS
jgi:HSP20 family molecular chaperone IbpA